MSNYLIKLNDKDELSGTRNTYMITLCLPCGSYYQTRPAKGCHQLKVNYPNQDKIIPLIKLIKALDIADISEETVNSFKFRGKSTCAHRIIFKLCRYIRTEGIFSIITKALELIDKGLNPINALILAHHISYDLRYYAGSMDLLCDTTNFRFYKSLDLFKEIVIKDNPRSINGLFWKVIGNDMRAYISGSVLAGKYKNIEEKLTK